MADLEPGLEDWAVLKGVTYADDSRACALGRGALTDSFILQHPQLSGPVHKEAWTPLVFWQPASALRHDLAQKLGLTLKCSL